MKSLTNNIKGHNMLRMGTISAVTLVALLGGFGLSGCSDSTEATGTTSSVTTTTTTSTTQASVNLVGKVSLDESKVDRRTMSTSKNVFNVVAYNLADKTEYQTLTDSNGAYALTGLTEGQYQIVASNNAYAQSAAVLQTLNRDTQAVVNITLRAAGSITGTAVGAEVVLIPGTSYLSTVDQNGNFELINVPVGEYTLYFDTGDDEGVMKNVSVNSGEKSIGSINLYALNVRYFGNETLDTTLGMQYGGVYIYLNRYIDTETLSGAVTLRAGENTYPVIIDIDNGNGGEDNNFNIYSDGPVPEGNYTLTLDSSIGFEQDVVFDLSLEDSAIVFKGGSNSEERGMGIAFPSSVEEITAENITVNGSDGSVVAVTITEDDGGYSLSGKFLSGVDYTVELSGLTGISSIKYIINDGMSSVPSISFDSVPAQINAYSIEPGDVISTTFYKNEVDLSSVSVSVSSDGNETVYNLTDSEINLRAYESYDYWYDYYYGRVYVDLNVPLSYATTYTVNVSAKNVYGDDISNTETFSTPTPIFTWVTPSEQEGIYIGDLINENGGIFQAEFNVMMNKSAGSLILTDLDNNTTVDTKGEFSDWDNYYMGKPRTLAPSTSYELTFTGFEAMDGTPLMDYTTSFKTPAPSMIYSSVNNGDVLDSNEVQWLNNKLEFAFFGELNATQISSMEEQMQITQYGEEMGVDVSHPTPKIVWQVEENFTKLVLAFTIEEEQNYELKFLDPTAVDGISLPYSMLSFSTIEPKAQEYSAELLNFNIVNNLWINEQSFNMSIKVPYYTATNNWSSSECGRNEWENNYVNPYDIVPSVEELSDMISVSSDTQDINSTESYSNVGSTYTTIYDEYDNHILVCYAYMDVYGEYDGGDYNTTYTLTVDTSYLENTGIMNATNSVRTDTYTTAEYGSFWTYYQQDMDGLGRLVVGSNVGLKVNDIIDYVNVWTDDNLTVLGIWVDSYDTFYVDANGSMTYDSVTYSYEYDENGTIISQTEVENDAYARGFNITLQSSNYAYTKYEISTDAGITSYDMRNGDFGASVLTEPIIGAYESIPDLTPMDVLGAESISIENSAIGVEFNKPAFMDDIVTFDEDGNITDIAFEVVDDSNNTIEIINVELGNDAEFADMNASGKYLLTMATPMDLNASYMLVLKTGYEITSPVSKLTLDKEVSLPLTPVVVSVGDISLIYQYRTLSGQSVNLNGYSNINSNYVSDYYLLAKLDLADGYMLQDSDMIDAYYGYESDPYANNRDSGDSIYNQAFGYVMQGLNSSSINLVEVSVTAENESGDVIENFESINGYMGSTTVPYISYAQTNGNTAVSIGLGYFYTDIVLSVDNFRVYSLDANTSEPEFEVANAITAVSHSQYSSNAVLDFNTTALESGITYHVEMLGVKMYEEDSIPADMPIDSFLIVTP